MTKQFIKKDSLEGLERDDITIIDSDNDVWAFMHGSWQSQMDNAWPDAPKVPVWMIIENDEPV